MIKKLVYILYLILISSHLAVAQSDVNSILFSNMTENERVESYLEELEKNYELNPLIALDIYDELKLLNDYLENDLAVWKAERMVAKSYLLIGDQERAFKYYDDLLNSKLTTQNIEKKFILYNDYAQANVEIGERKIAEKYFTRTLKIIRETESEQKLAKQLLKVGEFYFNVDSLKQSGKLIKEAINLNIKLGFKEKVAAGELKLSEINVKKRNFAKGFNLAQKARNYYDSSANFAGQSKATQLMGVCKCREGVFGPAAKLLDEAIELAKKDESSIDLKDFYFAKLELLIAKGEADSAKYYQNKILSYTNSVSRADQNRQLSLFRQRLESEKDEARIKSEEVASQKNITLFLSIVTFLSLVFLVLIFISFMKKRKSEAVLADKNIELLRLNNQFSSFLEQTAEAILIVDKDGKIILWNKFLADLTNISSEKAVGENYDFVFKRMILAEKELYKGFELGVKNCFEKLKTNTIEIQLTNKENKTKHIQFSFYPIETEKEIFAGILGRDRTLEKQYEIELIRSKNSAIASEKLKSEFLTQMSHEVRSPLGAILSFADVLENELSNKLDSDLADSFDSINNAGERIIRTTDLLLNMSSIQNRSYDYIKEEINLVDDIVLPQIKKHQVQAEKNGLKLYFSNKLNSEKLNIDKYSTTQILDNLIDNAIKYTKAGRIDVNLLETNNCSIISVKDTGIGIKEEYLEYLFEPFSQEEQGYTRSFEGNGLGLAIVKNFCDLNNFTIEVKSKKNIGSEFIVKIPK